MHRPARTGSYAAPSRPNWHRADPPICELSSAPPASTGVHATQMCGVTSVVSICVATGSPAARNSMQLPKLSCSKFAASYGLENHSFIRSLTGLEMAMTWVRRVNTAIRASSHRSIHRSLSLVTLRPRRFRCLRAIVRTGKVTDKHSYHAQEPDWTTCKRNCDRL